MQDKSNNIFTEIIINATPEEVWSVLTDWEKLKEWSSSFVGIKEDELKKGEVSTAYFKNPMNGKIMEFTHIVTDYEHGKIFGWSGELDAHGMTDHHIFSIKANDDGTTLFQQEDGFHGPHSKFMNFLAKHQMKSSYKRFNEELKARVESLFPRD